VGVSHEGKRVSGKWGEYQPKGNRKMKKVIAPRGEAQKYRGGKKVKTLKLGKHGIREGMTKNRLQLGGLKKKPFSGDRPRGATSLDQPKGRGSPHPPTGHCTKRGKKTKKKPGDFT